MDQNLRLELGFLQVWRGFFPGNPRVEMGSPFQDDKSTAVVLLMVRKCQTTIWDV